MADPIKIICEQGYSNQITSIFSLVAALLSGFCAFLSYKLSQKIREELKSDETVIVGKAIHPGLITYDHNNCIIVCTIFNKSKRKTYVNKVLVFDKNNNIIDTTWSKQIDDLGNPMFPCELIGIIDTEELYIRRNDGKWFNYCSVHIFHSFSTTPETVIFNG